MMSHSNEFLIHSKKMFNVEQLKFLKRKVLKGYIYNVCLEDENAAALAELEDVPMAAKKKRTINRGPKLDTKR